MGERRSTDPAHFLGPDPGRDVDAELEFHLELLAEKLRAEGMTPEAARRRAEAEFGDLAAARRECRDIGTRVVRRREWRDRLEGLVRELRYALRALRRAPGFALVMVLTIGFATGFALLIGGAVHGLGVTPLPFPEADRLVWVFGGTRERGDDADRLSSEEVQAIRASEHPFEKLAQFGDRNLVRVAGGVTERWAGLRATPGMAAVLGVRPALGRGFTEEEATQGLPVMLVSFERWQRDFGGDPALVGRILEFFDNKSYRVIGILPPGLAFPLARAPLTGGFGSGVVAGVQDFWLPMSETDGGTVLGRLRASATLAEADRFAESIAGRLAADRVIDPARRLLVVPMRSQILGVALPALRLLVLAAALVLLLALANLTNMTAARVTAREREFGVRTALGARPGSNIRILLTESVLLAAAGVLLGLALARLGVWSLSRFAAGQLPLGEQIGLGGPILSGAILLGLLIAGVLTLAPLRLLGRPGSAPLAAAAASGPTRRHARIRRGLVASQVAAALLLLAGEAAVLRSLYRLWTLDLGYDASRVVAVDLNVYRHPGGELTYAEMVRRIRALPGVERVGAIHSIPLTGKWTFREPLLAPGRPEQEGAARMASGNFVGFDYFGAMGIGLLEGRDFTEAEGRLPGVPVLIVSRSAAERFFPGGALGQVVKLAGTDRTIIGVVEDTRDARVDLAPEPQWYLPSYFAGSQLMVRTRSDPGAAVELIRRTIAGTDPRIVIHRIEPLEALVAGTLFERRLAVGLLGVVGLLALVIASVGLYGVLSYTVSERQRELGIRMAVGASPVAVRALVLREGLAITAAGIAAGLVLTLPLRGVVTGMLYQVRPVEPGILLLVSAGLLLVAMIACLGPAARASRVDPVRVLKGD
jgi:predicted permease